MLRSNLFKRFSKKKFEDAGTVTKPEETGLSIPTVEDIKKNFGINNPFVLDGYTTPEQPKGTVSTTESSFAPGTFSDLVKSPMFTTGFSPLNPYDINPKTPEPEQGPMTKEQSDYFVLDQSMPETKTPETKEDNRPAMVSLGLLGFNALLGKNEDLKNQQQFIESIQQRNSKPINDYNFKYGPNSSGGTEYQPTIKAEMGAKINKRYASEGMNDVEIEGGEYIQLPNLETEMASGPSHSNGGIPTNLPDQTRVYSNNIKPEGSKKTFAQIAKNYDITPYKKTLENPFAKQVDKDTASLMMQRNQKILDELFRDQQILNGDSNGEIEAKNGAGIDNPGFRALPKNVQEKILAEMKYGGVTKKETTPLVMLDGSDVKEPIPTYQPGTRAKVAKMDPKTSLLVAEVPGLQSTLPSGVYGQESNLDLFKKNYDWFIKDLEAQGETFDPKNKDQMRRAQVAYTEEVRNRALKAGYTPEEADKFASEMGFVPEEGSQRSIDSKLGLYTASRQLPNFEPKTPGTTPTEAAQNTSGTKVSDAQAAKTGKYTPGNFPLYQAIPEAMGLAQAQEIYAYGIPEIDAPYVRPQTLNIQSQLQDIDNMGTAAIRGGADPNMAYIAGLDAKQKAFQNKQNYDAEGRSRADMANAQMSMSADQFNAQAFDRVYNNLVGQARDAQSAEKQAAVASLTNKKAKFVQDENLKAMGVPLVAPGFNITSEGKITLPEDARAMFEFYNYMKEKESKAAPKTTAKKGMYKK